MSLTVSSNRSSKVLFLLLAIAVSPGCLTPPQLSLDALVPRRPLTSLGHKLFVRQRRQISRQRIPRARGGVAKRNVSAGAASSRRACRAGRALSAARTVRQALRPTRLIFVRVSTPRPVPSRRDWACREHF